MNGARVYVIDDDASVRAAIEDLLASVGLAAQGFGSTAAFLAHWRQADGSGDGTPACLVLDIRMPGQSGLEFQRQMQDLGMALPVVFITGHGDIPMSVQAMKGGAIEFLTKPFRDQDLLDAIQLGLGRDRDRRAQAQAQALLRARWDSLSPGEQAVVRGVAAGRLNKQIAADLGVSEITVKVRRAQAMRKMQVRTLAELLRVADPFCGTYTAPP
ncbi:MAG: response regulator transcription factor [Comamonadaceae bacterium]|nr:response regulator transcription factor [Comamonadaceae bacterium]